MTTTAETLSKATNIIRTELPSHLTGDFVIDGVEAECRPGPENEDYIHIMVILKDNHPDLAPRKVLEFSQAVTPLFEQAGIIPSPTISYANRNEIIK